MFRPKGDDRGQVLSSLVAVAAVVAIVAGLLVLFGTRGHDSEADEPSGATTPKPSTKPTSGPSTIAASIPRPSSKPTEPATTPTQAPSSTPTTEPSSSRPSRRRRTSGNPADDHPAGRATGRGDLQQHVAEGPGRLGRGPRPAGRLDRGRRRQLARQDRREHRLLPAGMLDAANQLARDIGVSRTKGALDNMKKDRLTVILTSDYAG